MAWPFKAEAFFALVVLWAFYSVEVTSSVSGPEVEAFAFSNEIPASQWPAHGMPFLDGNVSLPTAMDRALLAQINTAGTNIQWYRHWLSQRAADGTWERIFSGYNADSYWSYRWNLNLARIARAHALDHLYCDSKRPLYSSCDGENFQQRYASYYNGSIEQISIIHYRQTAEKLSFAPYRSISDIMCGGGLSSPNEGNSIYGCAAQSSPPWPKRTVFVTFPGLEAGCALVYAPTVDDNTTYTIATSCTLGLASGAQSRPPLWTAARVYSAGHLNVDSPLHGRGVMIFLNFNPNSPPDSINIIFNGSIVAAMSPYGIGFRYYETQPNHMQSCFSYYFNLSYVIYDEAKKSSVRVHQRYPTTPGMAFFSADTLFCQNSTDMVPVTEHGAWTDWSVCQPCTDCEDGPGMQNRTCTNPPPTNGGEDCLGASSQPCQPPQHGAWSDWGPCQFQYFDESSVAVGRQQRSCSNPAPMHGGDACPGSTLQRCQVPGGWSPWGACQVCVGGSGSQTRNCTSQNDGDVPCKGSSSQACSEPQDGGWGDWGPCSDCYSCGLLAPRTRFCVQPVPKNGGSYCEGSSMACFDEGTEPGWTAWSDCSSCDGKGYQYRTCSFLSNSDAYCSGSATQACIGNGGFDGCEEQAWVHVSLKMGFYSGTYGVPYPAQYAEQLRHSIATAMGIYSDSIVLERVYRLEDAESIGITYSFVKCAASGSQPDPDMAARFQTMMKDKNSDLYARGDLSDFLDPGYSLEKGSQTDQVKTGLIIGGCTFAGLILLFICYRQYKKHKQRVQPSRLSSGTGIAMQSVGPLPLPAALPRAPASNPVAPPVAPHVAPVRIHAYAQPLNHSHGKQPSTPVRPSVSPQYPSALPRPSVSPQYSSALPQPSAPYDAPPDYDEWDAPPEYSPPPDEI